MFFVCEVGSKFMPYCSVQLFCTEGLHDDVTEQKKQSTRGLGRAKTKKGSNSDLHDDVTEQKKQSTRGLDHASATKTKEGSNSDLHDDVTEQKKQSTRGLGRASATKTKNVHVDVIEPKGTRGLGRVAATNSPSDSPNNDVPCASMCDENWLYADSQYKKFSSFINTLSIFLYPSLCFGQLMKH
ncbi:uncharacterized protein LOC135345712 isoform X1 [Halichondria panicea]|uniref:uncharacterized protein LOC135345712 isoform X1 n=1 Tax=Halichondria panicea TaxID=6063 RepID=UPI00312B37EA